MTALLQPLNGLAIGLSASLGEDASDLGCTDKTLNQTVIELSTALLERGARLCFGHDWRPEGVMLAVTDAAKQLRSRSPERTDSCIQNFVHAETRSAITPELAEELSGIVQVSQLENPATEAASIQELDSALRQKIALLAMRRELARSVNRVLCLGGKWKGHSGWVPGILEEVLRNLQLKHPVFLCASFGGASAILYRAIVQRESAELETVQARLDEVLAQVAEEAGKNSPSYTDVAGLKRQWEELDPSLVSGSEAKTAEGLLADFLATV